MNMRGMYKLQDIDDVIAELKIKLLRIYMQELMVHIEIDRYVDSKGNLWVLKRDSKTKEPWHVMYVPIESRLKQQPKLRVKAVMNG